MLSSRSVSVTSSVATVCAKISSFFFLYLLLEVLNAWCYKACCWKVWVAQEVKQTRDTQACGKLLPNECC